MADAVSYPQIPSTVWSGVWKILHDSPSRRVDENVLAIELGVQKTAAKQYLKELQRLGLFKDDNSSTDLAKKWRQDGDDPDTIKEILERAYPQDLRELAPQDRLDRDKIVRWFVSQGLGAGAAQNKAATYMRIASGVSAIDQKQSSGATKASRTTASRRGRTTPISPTGNESQQNAPGGNTGSGGAGKPPKPERKQGRPELNVNVQIHISADSSSEQIDAIFAAMRRYFDGSEAA